MTEVIKLINNVETLFNVFVPGALCVWFYTKLSLKKIEYQGFLALSIALGFTIKYCVDYIDYLLGNFVIVGFPIVVVYVIVGILCAAIFFKVKNSVKVREWFGLKLGYETGDNVWSRHIDFKEGTYLMLHMNDGTFVYGKLENADDDYVVLTEHAIGKDRMGDSMTAAASNPNRDTALCIPMSSVKRFEFMYCNTESKIASYVLR